MSETENPAASSKRSITARLLAIGLPLAVLVAAVVLGALFFANRPQANRSAAPDKPKARLVTVAPAEPAPATLRIAANGTVEAAQATELRARVSGQILSLTDDLAPGTRFEKDDVLALNPDIVVLATGGIANTDIVKHGQDLAVTTWDILSGDAKPGENVLIYDETGDYAALQAAE